MYDLWNLRCLLAFWIDQMSAFYCGPAWKCLLVSLCRSLHWLAVRHRPLVFRICTSVCVCRHAWVYAQFPKRGFSRALLIHPSGWTDGVLWLGSPCMKDDSNVNDARGSLVLVRAHALAQTPEKLLPNGVIQNTFTPTEVERGSVNSRLQNSRSECRTTNQGKKKKNVEHSR